MTAARIAAASAIGARRSTARARSRSSIRIERSIRSALVATNSHDTGAQPMP
jgi:hypothetical protein